MEAGIKTEIIRVGGMTCIHCQNTIEKKLRGIKGVQKAEVRYSAGTAKVIYDGSMVSTQALGAAIEGLGYTVRGTEGAKSAAVYRSLGLLLIIAALYVVLESFGILNLLAPTQLAEANMGFGMLFVIGLITSVHCVAMCGGINLSQSLPKGADGKGESRFAALRPSLAYNVGRVLSYTIVGFLVGGLGSVISFSNAAQGILKLVAGAFMIIMGLNMLDVFPWLKRIQPRMPRIFARKLGAGAARGPFFIGMLNGLMPCGPLQAMQIYALSTGNPFSGALSMLLFSLGTVPLMFGLGALGSLFGKKHVQKIMTVGAVLVVVLGLSMGTQGWSLAHPSGMAQQPSAPSGEPQRIATDQVQVIDSTLSPSRYPSITVEVGTPVQWRINAPQGSINGCNNRIIFPAYGIEHTFKTGENIIEFTPTQTGTFRFSCWMGMIRGAVTVVEAGQGSASASGAGISLGVLGLDAAAAAAVAEAAPDKPLSLGACCQ